MEKGRAEGRVPAHGVTTIYFLARQARGPAFARRCVADILSIFPVAAVDDGVIREALALEWRDFEDAVCAAAARAADCTEVVTRNTDDFADAPLPVVDPASAVALLD